MCKVFFRGVRLTVIGRGTIGVRWTVEVKNSEAWLYAKGISSNGLSNIKHPISANKQCNPKQINYLYAVLKNSTAQHSYFSTSVTLAQHSTTQLIQATWPTQQQQKRH